MIQNNYKKYSSDRTISKHPKFLKLKMNYNSLIFNYEKLNGKKNDKLSYKDLENLIFNNVSYEELNDPEHETNKFRLFASSFIYKWFIILMECGRFDFARKTLDNIFINYLFLIVQNKYKKELYKNIHFILNDFENLYFQYLK